MTPGIPNTDKLKEFYKGRKKEIEDRLGYFRSVWDRNDEEIFSELCFCILTPQSRAETCDDIINNLKKDSLLFKAPAEKIMPFVKRARFYRNKSRYITEARRLFTQESGIKIKNRLDTRDITLARKWLVDNIKGIGYKEASHFLRNIGFGRDLAILDVHILKNLKEFGVIKDIPASLTPKRYLEIEEKVRDFSKGIKIPMDHLDLVFWSMETGKIFK